VRDIYTDLDIQRSTFDYRELWYCRIELDVAQRSVFPLYSPFGEARSRPCRLHMAARPRPRASPNSLTSASLQLWSVA
jgi:hypothetical protein